MLEGGGRSGEVAGQQVRSGFLQGQLREHREQRTLPGRGADRLAGQLVVRQRPIDAAPVGVVGRPDTVRQGVQARGRVWVGPVYLRDRITGQK